MTKYNKLVLSVVFSVLSTVPQAGQQVPETPNPCSLIFFPFFLSFFFFWGGGGGRGWGGG